MSDTQFETAVRALEDTLVRERELLLSGRAVESAELVKDKVSALEVFDSMLLGRSQASLSRDQRQRIDAVITLARENSMHFVAVRNGLKSAINRLETLGETSYVGAYGQNGACTPFPKATGGYLRKM